MFWKSPTSAAHTCSAEQNNFIWEYRRKKKLTSPAFPTRRRRKPFAGAEVVSLESWRAPLQAWPLPVFRTSQHQIPKPRAPTSARAPVRTAGAGAELAGQQVRPRCTSSFFPRFSSWQKSPDQLTDSSQMDKICYCSCRNGNNEIAILEALFNKIHYHQTNGVSLQKFIYSCVHLWN